MKADLIVDADSPGTEDTLPPPKSASTLLAEFAAGWTESHVRLRDIVGVLQERVYGVLLLVFAIPNAIPNPVPGITAVLGLPLVLIAGQMVMGRPRPWLPAVIGDRAIPAEDFRRFLAQADPWLKKVERLLRPRLRFLFSPGGERMLAAVALLMAVVLTLPIPLANLLPAVAICFIALAVVEYDGLFAIVGLIASAVSVVIASTVVYGFIRIGLYLIQNAFQ